MTQIGASRSALRSSNHLFGDFAVRLEQIVVPVPILLIKEPA